MKEVLKKTFPAAIKSVKDWKYSIPGAFKNFNKAEAISLFCDPRGGSTWLAETLNTLPATFIIDEPLHLKNSKEIKKLNFSWRQYIPEDADWPEARLVFEKLLQGKILNSGLCCRNSSIDMLKAKQLIFKFIRGKALLPWYVRQFNFKYSPVFLIRHPLAVAASIMRHPSWNYAFVPFEIPDSPFTEPYKVHEDYLKSLKTNEEQLTAFWCIANNMIIRHPSNNKAWITINYESLIMNKEIELKRIFDRWNLNMPIDIIKKSDSPSSTSLNKKVIEIEIQINNWKSQLSRKTQYDLFKVLEYFEVDYYGDSAMPIKTFM